MLFTLEDTFTDTLALPQTDLRSPSERFAVSKDLTGLELRLSRLFVADNKTPRFLMFPGYAQIYVLALVLTDTMGTQIPPDRLMQLSGFPRVDDGEELPIDRTLFYWQSDEATPVPPPRQMHLFLSVIKSKEALRNTAEVLREAGNQPAYQNILDTIMRSIQGFQLTAGMVLELANIVGGLLGHVSDKPLFTWFQSFTGIHGDFDQLGINTHSRKNVYVQADLKLIIRDAEREKLLLAEGV